MGKRKQRDDDDGPAPSAEPASIGQLTSHIANKQKRSDAYAKLKHKKQVSKFAALSAASVEVLHAARCKLKSSPAESQAHRKEETASCCG